jgi:hypothetical protein
VAKDGGCEALQASGASHHCSAASGSPPTPCDASVEQWVGGPHDLVRLPRQLRAPPLAQVHHLQYRHLRKDQRDAGSGKDSGIHCVESQRDSRQWVAPLVVDYLGVRRMVEEILGSSDQVGRPIQQEVEVGAVEHSQSQHVDCSWG